MKFPVAIYETTAHNLGERFYDRVEGLVVKTLPLQVNKAAQKHDLDPNFLWQILLGPKNWSRQVANGDLVALAVNIFDSAKQRNFLNIPLDRSIRGDLPEEAVGAIRGMGGWLRNQLRGAVVKVFAQELSFAVKDLQVGMSAGGEPITGKQAEEIVVARFVHHANKSLHWWREPALLHEIQDSFLR